MNAGLQGFRSAIRWLKRQPQSALVAILTLSLGIALTTCLFSILRGTLLRPLPFEGAERLVAVESFKASSTSSSGDGLRYRDYHELHQRRGSFEDVAAFSMYMTIVTPDGVTPDGVTPDGVTPDGVTSQGGATETYIGAEVSANLFDLVDAAPILGRGPREDAPTPEAVISEGVWRRQFGGDPNVLGRGIWVNQLLRTVVGVMPEGFAFPFRQEIWLDLRNSPTAEDRVSVVAKLRSDVSIPTANADLAVLVDGLREASPEALEGTAFRSRSYVAAHTDKRLQEAVVPMVAAGFGILLIVSANVANLLLVRAAGRRRDLAVSTALGASRGRQVAEGLAESLVLAVLAGVPGLLLAGLGIELYNRVATPNSDRTAFWVDVRMDAASVLFVVGVCLVTSLMAGLLPTLRASSGPIGEILKTGGSVSDRRGGQLSRIFVVAEVALSCGLLVVCGLLIRSVVNLHTFDPGFDATGVVTAKLSLVRPEDPSSRLTNVPRFYASLEQRLSALPGVRRVAFASTIPTQGSMWGEVEIETREASEAPRVRKMVTSPSFFEAMGVDLLAGRQFDARDTVDAAAVAIVNRSFARRFLSNGDPVGQRLRFGVFRRSPTWRTVVGVADDYEMGQVDDGRDPAAVYVPQAQATSPASYVALQVEGAPGAYAEVLRREVTATDRFAACFDIRSMDDVLAHRRWIYDSMSTLFTILGLVALVLATVGFHGVLSVAVAERSREYGLRMALGATAGDLRRRVLRAGLTQLGLGLILGLAMALAGARVLGFVLFRVEPWDPAVYLTVVGVLLACGLLACLKPAERAARVDPMVALRDS